jgi:MFS family permease
MIVGGGAWIAVQSTLNTAAQVTVPAWVRARALAVYGIVALGGLAIGSAFWGLLAEHLGLSVTLLCAAVTLAAGQILSLRYRLELEEKIDLSPSLHWPDPVLSSDPSPDAGPVLVTVEYMIDVARTYDFTSAMQGVRLERLRDGAYRWGLYNDSAVPSRFVEIFVVESWAEHLRQHARVTAADRKTEGVVRAFHIGPTPPNITHFLYARAAAPRH